MTAASASSEADAPETRAGHGWLLLTAAAWLVFGLLAGTAEWLAIFRPLGRSWLAAAWGPLLASLIWIPLTFTTATFASRVRLWPLCAPALLFHVTASLAASFVLNFLWGVGAAFLASAGLVDVPLTWADVLPNTAAYGLRYLHFNFGAYWLIALTVTVWHRWRSGVAPPGRDDAHWARSLPVKRGSKTVLVPVEEVDWIEGAGDYARLHVGGERLLSNARLKTLEERLDPALFARVHRSAIVNLARVRGLTHQSHGDYVAELQDGTTIRVARSRSRAVRARLGGLPSGGT